jgi:hypothetical protein
MTRSIGFALLLVIMSATGCAAKQSGGGRGPTIQRTDDTVERDRDDHSGDLTRPVFGQGR